MARRKLPPISIPNTLESMIEYTLISRILDRVCEMTTKPGNIQEMTLSYSPSSICWKLKHGE
jgi:hypothetical protein